jgi:isoleucyl-tRNA synthetase
MRREKGIGKALEAQLKITASGKLFSLLKHHADGLKEILNVSEVRILEGAGPNIAALAASGTKCARCWNFMPEVSSYGIWENVCDRCQGALHEMGIKPPEPDSPLSGAAEPEANQ